MKHSGTTTTIFVTVWAAVLFASFVIGICIKEVRFQRAGVESKADTEPEISSEVQVLSKTDQLVQELAQGQRRPMSGPGGARGPGGAEGPRNRSPEDRAGFGGGRMAGMGERFANMSEEERKEAIAQMRERSGGRRGGGMRGRSENMSEEERSQMRDRFEKMSEEEREEFRAQMRERFSGRRPQGDGQGGAGGRRRSGGSRQENN